MPNSIKHIIELSEEESVNKIFGSLVRLKEDTPAGSSDSLLIFNANSLWCGSAGCALEIVLFDDEGGWESVLSVNTGYSVSSAAEMPPVVKLGEHFEGGMRNLILGGSAPWVWRDNSYQLR